MGTGWFPVVVRNYIASHQANCERGRAWCEAKELHVVMKDDHLEFLYTPDKVLLVPEIATCLLPSPLAL